MIQTYFHTFYFCLHRCTTFCYFAQGYDMCPIVILLNELEARLDMQEERVRREMCMSILTSFCYICRVNPTIRKYLRREVLPSITDVCTRPEELGNLRGKIVRLMTDIDVPLKVCSRFNNSSCRFVCPSVFL